MRYFSLFPTIPYAMTEVEADTRRLVTRRVPNMTVTLKFREILESIPSLPYEIYRIQETERPDTLAAKMYGSSEYAWIILLANKMRDWYDWPLTSLEFDTYMNRKYESAPGTNDGVVRAQNLVDGMRLPDTQYYQLINGQRYYVNEETYMTLSLSDRGMVSVYDQELADNDARREIRILNASVVTSVVNQLNTLLKA